MPATPAELETDAEEVAAQADALFSRPWFPAIIDPRFVAFIKSEGRVPRLGDPIPAYNFKGWLLFQVWMLSGTGGIHARWPYYFECLAAGRLPGRPIPPLNFDAPEAAKARALKSLGKLTEKLGREHGYGERAFNVLLDWIGFGLACDDDPCPDLPAATSAWLYQNFDLSLLLTAPHDTLGDMLEQFRGKTKRYQGFFLTHEHVCELMAALAVDDYDGDLRVARVYEPAVGSARQLLQFSGLSHRLEGQDVDPVCTKISRVNGALFAPWLSFPLPDALLRAPVAADSPPVNEAHTEDEPPRAAEPPPPPLAAEEASGGRRHTESAQVSLFDL